MIDYARRLESGQKAMRQQGLDLLFLNLSGNLTYLTGIQREEPNYGNTMYPGEWLTGAWIPQTGEPVLTLPRMMAEFHMGARVEDIVVVRAAGGEALTGGFETLHVVD